MEDNRPPSVGAPTEYAEAQEVPEWFAQIVQFFMAGPVIIAFLCGGLPTLLAICYCIATLFL